MPDPSWTRYIGFPTLSTLDNAVRMNHFPGFEKNRDKQPEGDVDRGKECEGGTDEDDDSALS